MAITMLMPIKPIKNQTKYIINPLTDKKPELDFWLFILYDKRLYIQILIVFLRTSAYINWRIQAASATV